MLIGGWKLLDICVRLHLYPYSNKGTFHFRHKYTRKGRVMAYGKDMSKVYIKKTDMELRKLRARKLRMLQKVSQFNSYFARRDRDLLAHQIMQIDAVLESRKLQLHLL
jgi:hypothetical protein